MEELDLKDLVQIFWEKRMQIVLIVAIFLVIGVIYTMGFVTPKYQSTTKLLLATNSSSQNSGAITTTDVTLNSKLVSTYSVLVKSDRVLRTVIADLGINKTEEEIRKNVTVSAVGETEVIQITVKDEDPTIAAKVANEIANVFMEIVVKEYYGMENVHVVDEAEVASEPSNINHLKDVIIFTCVGVVISAMYVLIVNMLDTTIKSAEDIEKIAGVTVLAAIPVYESAMEAVKGKRRGGIK